MHFFSAAPNLLVGILPSTGKLPTYLGRCYMDIYVSVVRILSIAFLFCKILQILYSSNAVPVIRNDHSNSSTAFFLCSLPVAIVAQNN